MGYRPRLGTCNVYYANIKLVSISSIGCPLGTVFIGHFILKLICERYNMEEKNIIYEKSDSEKQEFNINDISKLCGSRN